MQFDDLTLNRSYSFAARLFDQTRHLSARDQKLVLLGCLSGLRLSSAGLENIRCSLTPELSGCDRILFAIAALSEADRLAGARQLPPVELVDLMSHLLPLQAMHEKDCPTDTLQGTLICHSDHTVQLALWFAAHGMEVLYSGTEDYIRHIAAFTKGTVFALPETEELWSTAFHFAIHNTGNDDAAAPFLRRLLKTGCKGAVVMTNWSFLSASSPRSLQLKQRLISSNCLLSVTQFPEGVMPRMLPALLQIGPAKSRPHPVRLVNARDWFVSGRQGLLEISYLNPILAQIYRWPEDKLPRWSPRPPAEDVMPDELLNRRCDLRLRVTPHVAHGLPSNWESLGGCASLVRGQMLAKSKSPETSQTFHEVLLADINEHGFISSASRLVEDAAPLPRSRKVARLREGDILIVCKGALQSLGKVGFVTRNDSDWLPSQTFYLIRTEGMDPIWLFHYLRSEEAQNYFRTHSSGTSIPQIQVADIAAMRIPVPDEDALELVHVLHAKALKLERKLAKLRQEAVELRRESDKLFRGLRRSDG